MSYGVQVILAVLSSLCARNSMFVVRTSSCAECRTPSRICERRMEGKRKDLFSLSVKRRSACLRFRRKLVTLKSRRRTRMMTSSTLTVLDLFVTDVSPRMYACRSTDYYSLFDFCISPSHSTSSRNTQSPKSSSLKK